MNRKVASRWLGARERFRGDAASREVFAEERSGAKLGWPEYTAFILSIVWGRCALSERARVLPVLGCRVWFVALLP